MSDYLTLPEVAATLRCSERYAAAIFATGRRRPQRRIA